MTFVTCFGQLLRLSSSQRIFDASEDYFIAMIPETKRVFVFSFKKKSGVKTAASDLPQAYSCEKNLPWRKGLRDSEGSAAAPVKLWHLLGYGLKTRYFLSCVPCPVALLVS